MGQLYQIEARKIIVVVRYFYTGNYYRIHIYSGLHDILATSENVCFRAGSGKMSFLAKAAQKQTFSVACAKDITSL